MNDASGRGTKEKRSIQDVFGDDDEANADKAVLSKRQKTSRLEALQDDAPLPPTLPEPIDGSAIMDATQVSAMVANMKKQIEERKKQLGKDHSFWLISWIVQAIKNTNKIIMRWF